MPIGLGSLKKKTEPKDKKSDKPNSSKDEAAAVLKQMQEKADTDACPFC